jgi:hypothetical protein
VSKATENGLAAIGGAAQEGHEVGEPLTVPGGYLVPLVLVERIVMLRDPVLQHLSALRQLRGKTAGVLWRHVLLFVEQRHHVAGK